ncbi:Hypothetical predicted protein [Mytilus galloprovincialis]|uniref:Uncharacterized protein n=1 Tax=Mytilus galloprovincialis TaxID=29158 RepID=A0A8B6DUW3_MYTGA|nr:Hypothetical predicted protein [Mytilus galloprovincialis]
MCNLVKLLLLLVGRNTKLNIGRGKVLSFKKSARGIFYLDLIASNGSMKLNLGLNELDDLFTLRGHLESLTAYFPQNKNKDGLVYADLVFKNDGKRRFVIRGIENRTDYADIDLEMKADPLPSDESDKEEDTALNEEK